MAVIALLVYAALGYWAAGKTIYANKIRIGTAKNLFGTRLGAGLFFGPVIIPIAIIRVIFHI